MIERRGPDPANLRAVGWATVELERATRELAPLLASGSGFEVAPDCILLGARCLVGRAADATVAGAPLVVLLEPSTEGRLAVTLARHGESWCATWEAGHGPPPGVDVDPGRDVPSMHRLSVVRDGPFGPERLVLDGPVDGPHHILVQAATIRP